MLTIRQWFNMILKFFFNNDPCPRTSNLFISLISSKMLHIEKKFNLLICGTKIKSEECLDECISLDIFLGLNPIVLNYVESVTEPLPRFLSWLLWDECVLFPDVRYQLADSSLRFFLSARFILILLCSYLIEQHHT